MYTAVIIEDEAFAGDLMEFMIKAHCPQIDTVGVASFLKEGIDLIHSHQPDILFVDINLPDGEGPDILPVLKAAHIDIPIIFMSAKLENRDKVEGIPNSTFLPKPLQIEVLKQTVAQFLD